MEHLNVKPGHHLPDDVTLWKLVDGKGPFPVQSSELWKDDDVVVLVGVPGPFTIGCSKSHLPGIIEAIAQKRFASKGVNKVYVVSTADAFVMDAWKDSYGNMKGKEGVTMLSDANMELTRRLGLVLDGRAKGMGMRGQRYSMIIHRGIIRDIQVDGPGKIETTKAETILSRL